MGKMNYAAAANGRKASVYLRNKPEIHVPEEGKTENVKIKKPAPNLIGTG